MLKRWKPVESIDALGGDGVIAGELSGDPEVPDGLLTVNGVPTSREIEVRDRKTRRVVSVRRSNADGTYRFPGLNPALQYDVIARDFAGDYEDVIAGAVRPHTPDLLVPVAAGDKMAVFGDLYGPDVVSLLHFDGPAGSKTFTDETGKPWTAFGAAQIDTAQAKFGTASGLFDGSSSHVTTPSGVAFAFGAGDFTVEMFARQVAAVTGDRSLFCVATTGGLSMGLQGGKIFAGPTGVSYGVMASSAISTDVWYHLAACRHGSTMRIFVDGIQVAAAADSYNYQQGIAGVGAGSVNGYSTITSRYSGRLDELRITKGVARYTANFTPPTAPFEL